MIFCYHICRGNSRLSNAYMLSMLAELKYIAFHVPHLEWCDSGLRSVHSSSVFDECCTAGLLFTCCLKTNWICLKKYLVNEWFCFKNCVFWSNVCSFFFLLFLMFFILGSLHLCNHLSLSHIWIWHVDSLLAHFHHKKKKNQTCSCKIFVLTNKAEIFFYFYFLDLWPWFVCLKFTRNGKRQ